MKRRSPSISQYSRPLRHNPCSVVGCLMVGDPLKIVIDQRLHAEIVEDSDQRGGRRGEAFAPGAGPEIGRKPLQVWNAAHARLDANLANTPTSSRCGDHRNWSIGVTLRSR
jgi:hypothetical protein